MKCQLRARPDASSPIQCAPARTRPPLSNLVRRATELRLISLACIAQLAALQLGVAAWQCPCFALTRLPCPGCGLSRAMTALATGNISDAWAAHPFSFLALPVLVTGAILCLLPVRSRLRVSRRLSVWEHRWRPLPWISYALLAFGLLRILHRLFVTPTDPPLFP